MADSTNGGRDHVFTELRDAYENNGLDPDTLIKRFGAARRVFRESTGNEATYQWNFNNPG
jgi:hypothetical protein